MKNNITLTIVSLLTLVLSLIHIIHDIMHGTEPPRAIINMSVIGFVWLSVTVLLAGRTLGYIVVFLGSLLAAGMPVLHTMNATTAKWDFGFYLTLLLLGVTGLFGALLSAIALWKHFRARRNNAATSRASS
ncbi:MAG TPA: hypothetical protein VKH19_15420 [Gemmatimonadaceae bacterium]|nr:hypothetical protein [Gemmatimonadaceae bacterium]